MLILACAGATPSVAQEMYPGQDVIVNPGAAGTRILLYPGGKYGRVVHPLLQPGQPYPGTAEKPIHLHMPVHRVAKVHRNPPAEPVATAAATPPPRATQQTAPQPAPDSAPDLSAYSGAVALTAAAPSIRKMAAAPAHGTPPRAVMTAAVAPPPKPAPQKPTAAAPKPATAAPATFTDGAAPVQFSLAPEPSGLPAARYAKADIPPRQTTASAQAVNQASAGLVRQSQIIFGQGAADPVPESIDAIKSLAAPLNSALANGASRVQVVAYGGARGDKSSGARRLSLRRALIIRQLLIDGGVPSERIDVRAMGGATDKDPTDRVDVFTKS